MYRLGNHNSIQVNNPAKRTPSNLARNSSPALATNGEPWFIYVVPVIETGPVPVGAGYPGAGVIVSLESTEEAPPNGMVLLTVPKAPGATPVGVEDVQGVGTGGGGAHT